MPTPEERSESEYTEFYRTTGEVIREWCELEQCFVFHLSSLLGIDEFRSRIIWESQPNWRGRYRLLSRLGETYLADPQAAAFRKLLKRTEAITSNRNMLAHAHGGIDERVNTLVFLWDDDDRQVGFNFLGKKTIQVANLRTWVKDIQRLRDDFMVFWKDEMKGAVMARPKMHRDQP